MRLISCPVKQSDTRLDRKRRGEGNQGIRHVVQLTNLYVDPKLALKHKEIRVLLINVKKKNDVRTPDCLENRWLEKQFGVWLEISLENAINNWEQKVELQKEGGRERG